MELSPQQKEASEKISAWLKAGQEQVFYLAGYAGTGKTTIAQILAKQAKGKTVYAAYTGKAAVVMRKSGCYNANTIHSTIYEAKRNERTGKYVFRFNENGACADAGIIVIDECSMVGEKIGADLLRYGRPVLVLGDPAQLPPIKSGGFFTEREPNMMLTEIHRQAEGNPIIHLATMVRNGQRPPINTYGQSAVIDSASITSQTIMSADQILVGRNKTRELYNNRIRELLEKPKGLPVPGDRLVCLKNDHALGIFNGGIYTVDSIASTGDPETIGLVVRSEDFPEADFVEAEVRKEFFLGGEKDIPWQDLMGLQQFTYGYALTVHKSQGSQWGNVVLFDQSSNFKEWERHLYTGITRASDQITIVY